MEGTREGRKVCVLIIDAPLRVAGCKVKNHVCKPNRATCGRGVVVDRRGGVRRGDVRRRGDGRGGGGGGGGGGGDRDDDDDDDDHDPDYNPDYNPNYGPVLDPDGDGSSSSSSSESDPDYDGDDNDEDDDDLDDLDDLDDPDYDPTDYDPCDEDDDDAVELYRDFANIVLNVARCCGIAFEGWVGMTKKATNTNLKDMRAYAIQSGVSYEKDWSASHVVQSSYSEESILKFFHDIHVGRGVHWHFLHATLAWQCIRRDARRVWMWAAGKYGIEEDKEKDEDEDDGNHDCALTSDEEFLKRRNYVHLHHNKAMRGNMRINSNFGDPPWDRLSAIVRNKSLDLKVAEEIVMETLIAVEVIDPGLCFFLDRLVAGGFAILSKSDRKELDGVMPSRDKITIGQLQRYIAADAGRKGGCIDFSDEEKKDVGRFGYFFLNADGTLNGKNRWQWIISGRTYTRNADTSPPRSAVIWHKDAEEKKYPLRRGTDVPKRAPVRVKFEVWKKGLGSNKETFEVLNAALKDGKKSGFKRMITLSKVCEVYECLDDRYPRTHLWELGWRWKILPTPAILQTPAMIDDGGASDGNDDDDDDDVRAAIAASLVVDVGRGCENTAALGGGGRGGGRDGTKLQPEVIDLTSDEDTSGGSMDRSGGEGRGGVGEIVDADDQRAGGGCGWKRRKGERSITE